MKPLLYHIYVGRYKRGGEGGREGEDTAFKGGFGDLLLDEMMNKEYQKALV